MTTTAHEDQFTVGTQTIEPVRQPYSTEAILRRNIADMEVALRTQTERAEAAEAELAQARQQKPLTWGTSGELMDILKNPIYSSPAPVPVPAPAVPELDPMTRLIVSDPKQLKPKKQEPAVPSVVFMAHNKTSSILFAARKDADQYAASFGPAAGVSVTECAVIGSQSAPQAPAVPEFCAVEAQLTLAEIIRNARRYLALRENEISIMQLAAQDFDHSAFRIEYDAAADRMLEGGE